MSWILFWIVVCSPIILLGILGAKDWLPKKRAPIGSHDATDRGSTITTIHARRAAR